MRITDLACIAVATAVAATLATTAAPAAPAVTVVPVPVATPAMVTVAAAATGTLSLTFTGIQAPKGAIMLALYDAQGWAGGKPVRAEMLDASAGAEATATFKDLPAGRYGVKAFHDLNGNGRMDVNPFGMPTEPFAFSRDAHGAMGPAKWDDAAFDLAAGDNAQRIAIR